MNFRIFFGIGLILLIVLHIINAQNFTTENLVTSSTTLNETETTTTENIVQKQASNSLCEKRDKPYFLPHKTEMHQFYV